MPDVRSWLHKKTAEDERAIAIFEAHKHEFALDEGGQLSRYEEARKFTEQYFKGTPYAVEVEEYCCMCTVTSLYRHQPIPSSKIKKSLEVSIVSTLELLYQLIDQANSESGGEFPSVDVDPDGEDTLVQIGGRYGIVLRFDSDGKYVDNE